MSFVFSLDITHFVLATQVYTCNEFNKSVCVTCLLRLYVQTPQKHLLKTYSLILIMPLFIYLFLFWGGGEVYKSLDVS